MELDAGGVVALDNRLTVLLTAGDVGLRHRENSPQVSRDPLLRVLWRVDLAWVHPKSPQGFQGGLLGDLGQLGTGHACSSGSGTDRTGDERDHGRTDVPRRKSRTVLYPCLDQEGRVRVLTWEQDQPWR